MFIFGNMWHMLKRLAYSFSPSAYICMYFDGHCFCMNKEKKSCAKVGYSPKLSVPKGNLCRRQLVRQRLKYIIYTSENQSFWINITNWIILMRILLGWKNAYLCTKFEGTFCKHQVIFNACNRQWIFVTF